MISPEIVALFERAVRLQGEGRLTESAGVYASLLRQNDSVAEAYNNLGHVQQLLGQHAEAVISLRRAIAIGPSFKEAYNNLGTALHAMGAYDQAIDSYRDALGIDPDFAGAHGNLGIALRVTGRLADAEQHLRCAIALDPRNGCYHRLLVELAPAVETAHLRQMEELVRPESMLPIDQRIELHFALAAAYAERSAYGFAFENLAAGNALKRSTLSYDEDTELHAFERLARGFPSALFGGIGPCGDPSNVPVFIFGMPRSGTTLVEQMLAAHPGVYAGGELGVCAPAVEDFRIDVDPSDTAQFARVMAEQFTTLGARCARQLEAHAPSAKRVTDKWPWSFKFAGAIALALPNARMIHVRRDPADICFSSYATLFTNTIPYMYDLAEIGRYYRAYERLMAHWDDVLPPGAMLHVHYEELVDSFEPQARRIVDYCGLPWADECLAFSSVQRPVRTASAVAVRRPLNRDGIGRATPYRGYLDPLFNALGL